MRPCVTRSICTGVLPALKQIRHFVDVVNLTCTAQALKRLRLASLAGRPDGEGPAQLSCSTVPDAWMRNSCRRRIRRIARLYEPLHLLRIVEQRDNRVSRDKSMPAHARCLPLAPHKTPSISDGHAPHESPVYNVPLVVNGRIGRTLRYENGTDGGPVTRSPCAFSSPEYVRECKHMQAQDTHVACLYDMSQYFGALKRACEI
jgi:hypothetical protein